MNNQEIQRRLNDNGFPCGAVDGVIGQQTRDAVSRFQVAYCGPGGWLDIDGNPGQRTQEALEFLPRLSTHFTAQEVMCKCGCRTAYVNRQILSGLEDLREAHGSPIKLLSAYRCEKHNKAVGGAKESMHKHGAAADLDTYVSTATARRANRFGGIGTRDRGKRASHVDMRHVMGNLNQTPGASPEHPVTWAY